jgi:hypothetical protein
VSGEALCWRHHYVVKRRSSSIRAQKMHRAILGNAKRIGNSVLEMPILAYQGFRSTPDRPNFLLAFPLSSSSERHYFPPFSYYLVYASASVIDREIASRALLSAVSKLLSSFFLLSIGQMRPKLQGRKEHEWKEEENGNCTEIKN